jgi:capsular exopolysaccharide synthesis family protein
MSKIHDALKKAEQERAAAPHAETSLITSQPEVGVDYPGNSRESAVPAHRGGPAFEPPAADMLLTRCAQPHWSPAVKSALLSDSQHHLMGSEEFRTLRSRLYQIRDRRPLRTLLVTSPLPSEGKTFVTSNLAHAFVRQHERRALVIDADLRAPQLHVALGAPSSPGLTDYLSGEADELTILQRGPKGNLYFIPSGKSVHNPAELIANGRLKVLLERLAPLFDWVLLDSPPAIPVSDPSVMAKLCDGVLLVVRAGATPFDLAQKARQEFEENSLLGVVLNVVAPSEIYGGYYYSYYHKDGKNGRKG